MKKFITLIVTLIVLTINVAAQQKVTYPAVITFNSMCCGVPSDAPVMKFIKSFKKQYKIKKIAVDRIGPMGREGEYYLAFKLKELTKAQKQKFISQLKKIVPTMVDQGSAELKVNETIDLAELGRATVATQKL